MKIGVLFGGASQEREVSLESGKAIFKDQIHENAAKIIGLMF